MRTRTRTPATPTTRSLPGTSTSQAATPAPTPGTLVYLTTAGGDPGIGAGTNNTAAVNVDAIGTCNYLQTSVQFLSVNELTTVGAIRALYPYTTNYTAIGAADQTALATAFNLSTEYVNFQNGQAPGPNLPAGKYASTTDVNALSNVIAACVNTTGGTYNDGSACGQLFFYTKPASSAAATDTVGALRYIFQNPSNNVANIFNLQAPAAPFMPVPSTPPPDFSLPILTQPGTPTFTPAGGSYSAAQSVTIADSDPTAVLYYTTDGSTPTTSSTVYTGPLTVGTAETLQALAVESGRAFSAVGSATYSGTLTVLTAPTVSLASLSTTYGSTTGLTLTATSNVYGSVVTFGTAGSIGGSFSAATCTISPNFCSVTYTPSGTLGAGTYTNDLTANFAARGSYGAGNATGTLTVAAGYAYTQTHAFTEAIISGTVKDGGSPNAGLVQGSDGSFYGTASAGGASGYGTVFKISADGSTYTQLHAFTAAIISGTVRDGANPNVGLVQGSDGSFYGTTYAGGAGNYGTVFKISADGSTYTQLHAFTNAALPAGGTDGENPYAVLVQGSDGSFYGTTNGGGASGYGTVFKISADGSTYTQLHAFTAAIISGTVKDGASPYAGLVQGSDGSFYGTTNGGGASGYGTVFKISADGSTYTQLHAFTAAIISGTVRDGANPHAGLVQGSDGNFYGTTYGGGAGGYGTVFKSSADGSTYTQLHAFTEAIISGTVKDGGSPLAVLVQGSDGSYYGTTSVGGASTYGTVFKISADGSTYTQLHAFTEAIISGTVKDGGHPYAGLVQGSDGSFYGTTYQGGASNYGTLFKIAPSPLLAAPVTLTVPASVTHGASFTLGYAVSNAASTTLQTCFATNTGGDTTGWTGSKTASPTNTNATLTAPATAGTYNYTLTCGGMESGFATLNVN